METFCTMLSHSQVVILSSMLMQGQHRCIMFCDSGMMHWDCLVYVTFKHAHYEFLQTCFILQIFYTEYGGAIKLSEHKRAVSEE